MCRGHAALVVALGDAPLDLSAVTFLPADTPLHFWARRQAHETAIHRLDVSGAAGQAVSFSADFAQDGIAEMLGGFARRRRDPSTPATIGLAATDGPSWLIRLGGERIEAAPADAGSADAQVAGTSAELYRWLWNRPCAAQVSGDPAVLAWWADNVRVR